MDFVNGISMAGGDGSESYSKNSLYQKAVMEASKLLIQSAIADHFKPPHSGDSLCIADLGCSVGPNTFIAVENILESIKLKYENRNDETPDFQVYFNDHTLNDFNTLFKSLPPSREYYASGVPGSFYSRLFPCKSLHIVYSSYSLQWLSQVPGEIMDPKSPAYNKGRIHYIGNSEEVVKAYVRQHEKDFSNFLHARAREMVPGGLLLLILPARPDEVHYSNDAFVWMNDQLGASLMDLAKKGVFNEEKVDTFNLPEYFPTPQEFKNIITRNGHFDIRKMEGLPAANAAYLPSTPEEVSRGIRAVMAELVKAHFGPEILDDVFRTLRDRLAEPDKNKKPGSELNLFIALTRKDDDNK